MSSVCFFQGTSSIYVSSHVIFNKNYPVSRFVMYFRELYPCWTYSVIENKILSICALCFTLCFCSLLNYPCFLCHVFAVITGGLDSKLALWDFSKGRPNKIMDFGMSALCFALNFYVLLSAALKQLPVVILHFPLKKYYYMQIKIS